MVIDSAVSIFSRPWPIAFFSWVTRGCCPPPIGSSAPWYCNRFTLRHSFSEYSGLGGVEEFRLLCDAFQVLLQVVQPKDDVPAVVVEGHTLPVFVARHVGEDQQRRDEVPGSGGLPDGVAHLDGPINRLLQWGRDSFQPAVGSAEEPLAGAVQLVGPALYRHGEPRHRVDPERGLAQQMPTGAQKNFFCTANSLQPGTSPDRKPRPEPTSRLLSEDRVNIYTGSI